MVNLGMYLRFTLLILVDILANLIGYSINPLLPMFCDSDGNLPKFLKWFQTQDATLDCMTEPRFIESTQSLRNQEGTPKGRWQRYLCRMLWLYRNNAYGFSYYVLGATGPFTIVSQEGVVPSDRYPAKEGKYFSVVQAVNGKHYFTFRYVKSRNNGMCYEAYLGWKISESSIASIVIRWTPFRQFETSAI